MTINSNVAMTKTLGGLWTIDQPTINGWQTSYNPDTDSVCMHGADGRIVRSWSMTNKRGEPSRRGWDNLVYTARRMKAPVYDPACTLDQGQYPIDGEALVNLLQN